MKTLKDFTPEVQAKIPEYITRFTQGVFDGQRYKDFNIESAANLIDWNYETAKYKKPCILVAENPYEAQIFFNYIKANEKMFLPIIYTIYCLRNGTELNSTGASVENKQLYSQLDSQLRSQLRSQLKKYNPDYIFTANVYSNWYAGYYTFLAD